MSLRLDHDPSGFRVRITGDRGKKNVDVTAQTYDEVIRSVQHFYLMHPATFDRGSCPLCRAADRPRPGPRQPRRPRAATARCQARSPGGMTASGVLPPKGTPCGLPAGHAGDHSALMPTSAPWWPRRHEEGGRGV